MSSSSYLSRSGSAEWVNSRFERAVDIIQSLPKSGPIQTSYDDKLLLYSVYKQATEGNLTTSRPGMLDVLGRAKWDAWNKRKNVTEFEAKRIYVDGLIKILKGFSDRSLAVSHVRELENFTLNPRRPFGSQGQSGRQIQSSSSSTDSESDSEGSENDRYQEASSSRSNQQQRQGPSISQQSNRNQSSQSYPSTSSQPPIHHHRQSNRRDQITPKRRELEPNNSVAPSLPGYGPPRTTVDNLRERSYSSSRSDRSESYSGREDRSDPGRITPVQRLPPNSQIRNPIPTNSSMRVPPSASSITGASHVSKPPIDLALDRIQISLTTLHQRLNNLETKPPTPAEQNGKLTKTITSSPIQNLFQLLFFHSKLLNSPGTLREKVTVLLTALLKASLKGIGRITLDLLVGIFMVGIFRRIFIGRKTIDFVKKALT